jgi:hypothetical protein
MNNASNSEFVKAVQRAAYEKDVLLSVFLGAFAKLRKATISYVMSSRPSARNNSVPTGRISMEFYI